MIPKRWTPAVVLVVLASALSLNFTRQSPDKAKAEQLIAEWERAKAFTHDYLMAATNEVIVFKPTPEMRTFGQQMLHLAEGNYAMAAAASGKQSPVSFGQLEKNPDQYKTKEALTKVVLDSYDFMIGALKGIDPATLNEKIKVFGFDLSRELTIMKGFEHQTHHRGQTVVYLRLKGVTPPEEKLF